MNSVEQKAFEMRKDLLPVLLRYTIFDGLKRFGFAQQGGQFVALAVIALGNVASFGGAAHHRILDGNIFLFGLYVVRSEHCGICHILVFTRFKNGLDIEVCIACMRLNELSPGRHFVSHQHAKDTICFGSALDGHLFQGPGGWIHGGFP
jgi:hypothetical protein